MIEAFLWGGIAASSLLIGGLLALRLTIPERTVGLIMGFGAGVLLSAVAYDLVLDATLTETRMWSSFSGCWPAHSSFSSETDTSSAKVRVTAKPTVRQKVLGGWLSFLAPFSTAFRSRSSWV